jgi:hypothetical protein
VNDSISGARYLFTEINHQCGNYLGKSEVYFFQDMQTGIPSDVIENEWGHTVHKNSVLIRERILPVDPNTAQNYKFWEMNVTLGVSAHDLSFDELNSGLQGTVYAYGGGSLTVTQDVDARHALAIVGYNIKQNESPKNTYLISTTSLSFLSSSKHALFFDYWIEPQSMQSILALTKHPTPSPSPSPTTRISPLTNSPSESAHSSPIPTQTVPPSVNSPSERSDLSSREPSISRANPPSKFFIRRKVSIISIFILDTIPIDSKNWILVNSKNSINLIPYIDGLNHTAIVVELELVKELKYGSLLKLQVSSPALTTDYDERPKFLITSLSQQIIPIQDESLKNEVLQIEFWFDVYFSESPIFANFSIIFKKPITEINGSWEWLLFVDDENAGTDASPDRKRNSNLSLTIGLSAGIPILLIILCLIAYRMYKQKQRLENERKLEDEEDSISSRSLLSSASTITTLYSSSKASHPQKYFRYSQDSESVAGVGYRN